MLVSKLCHRCLEDTFSNLTSLRFQKAHFLYPHLALFLNYFGDIGNKFGLSHCWTDLWLFCWILYEHTYIGVHVRSPTLSTVFEWVLICVSHCPLYTDVLKPGWAECFSIKTTYLNPIRASCCFYSYANILHLYSKQCLAQSDFGIGSLIALKHY